MSFLALSTMQMLLLAAVTTGAVLALFFLRLRHRRIVVASSLLWQRVLDHRHALSIWEKLRRWVSLMIALAIALLLALALGRPYLGDASGSARGPVVVVLDSSPSMETLTSAGRSRWEEALEEARRIVNSTVSAGGFMVSDTAGRMLTPLTEDRDAILRALDEMKPSGAGGNFPTVPVEGANVFFITDGIDSVEVPASVNLVSVFEAADNVGITAFEIEVDPTSGSGYTAYLEVGNYSEGPKDARIVMSGVGGRRLAQDVSLRPGEAWNTSMDLTAFEGGGIRAGVQAEGDALDLDDVAFGYLPSGKSRIALVTDAVDGYLETLLSLSPRVELTRLRTAEFQDDFNGDAYVFEGFAPADAPSLPSLLFGVAPVDWLPRASGVREDVRITNWLEDHPVMRSVPVYDVSIDRVPILELAEGSERRLTLASGDATPLIFVDPRSSGPRIVVVAFNLADSDFPFQLGFPVFVGNVVSWFSGDGLAEQHALGEIELPIGTTSVTHLDGTPLETSNRLGREVMVADRPGLFTVSAEGRRIHIAANLTDPTFSNINQTRMDTERGAEKSSLAGAELWTYLLPAALLLLCLEWWTYNRRITL